MVTPARPAARPPTSAAPTVRRQAATSARSRRCCWAAHGVHRRRGEHHGFERGPVGGSTCTARPAASTSFTAPRQRPVEQHRRGAAGVVQRHGRDETLRPDPRHDVLLPGRADDATSWTPGSNVQSFKTLAGPPVIQNVSVDLITDTTASVHFPINPQGSDTTYFVDTGPARTYAQQTQPVDVGSAPGFWIRRSTSPGSTRAARSISTSSRATHPAECRQRRQLFQHLQQVTASPASR